MEKIFRNGDHRVVIVNDPDAESPREYGSEDLFLVAFHKQFWVTGNGLSEPEAAEDWKDDYIIFPLSAYIHGGVLLYLGNHRACQFDSGQVGYVLAKKDLFPDPDAAAEALVSEWNTYLSNDVWGVGIEKLSCKKCDTWEPEEMLWGNYGLEYAEEIAEEMKESIRGEWIEEI